MGCGSGLACPKFSHVFVKGLSLPLSELPSPSQSFASADVFESVCCGCRLPFGPMSIKHAAETLLANHRFAQNVRAFWGDSGTEMRTLRLDISAGVACKLENMGFSACMNCKLEAMGIPPCIL